MAGNMVNSLWYGKDNTEKKKDEIRKQELYNAVYYSKSKEIALKIPAAMSQCVNLSEADAKKLYVLLYKVLAGFTENQSED